MMPTKKMSATILELAETLLVKPTSQTSAEAINAALLLAHTAWNRTIEPPRGKANEYTKVLPLLERNKPDLWNELKSRDCEAMIQELMKLKLERHPMDQRFIVVCGTTASGNVHVEFVNRDRIN
jgi:hypothetical protein